ncbi:MAG: hypothetical protein GX647_12410 [Clostridiales bacterium]|nr:hypothetical protein [Clostridiales bacterium]
MITTAGTVRECIFDLRKRFTPFALQMPHPKNKKAAENPCVTRVFSRLPIKNHPTGLYQILSDEVAYYDTFDANPFHQQVIQISTICALAALHQPVPHAAPACSSAAPTDR